MKVAADLSVEQSTTNLTYVIKSTKCTCIEHVLPYVINYQHVYIAISIIIGVALQEYEEYNNLQH